MENQKTSIHEWEHKKSRLLADYPQLTQEDLIYEAGKEEELVKRLQKKLEASEEEIRGWLSLMG